MNDSYHVRLGTNNIYNAQGDWIGTMKDEQTADDIAFILNNHADDDILNEDEEDLIDILRDEEIDNSVHLRNVIEAAMKHKANQEHFSNMYDLVRDLLSFEVGDEVIDKLNKLAELIENVDVKKLKAKRGKPMARKLQQ